MSRALRAYGPVLLWAGFLFFMGGRSNLPGPQLDLSLEKLAHFTAYGILGGLAAWGWRRAGRWPHWALPLAMVLLVGACDEVHQRSVEGRTAEVADWMADAAGGMLAFGLFRRGSGRSRERGGDES